MAGRFSVEAVFRGVDKITAPVARMQKNVGAATRSLENSFRGLNRRMSSFASSAKHAGIVAAGAMLFVGGAVGNVLASGAKFEQAITDVGAVGLQTRAEIAPLEKLALDLGRTTKFTATEAANAMEIMARAGFDNNQILAATPGILAAAAAEGIEIAEVAGHVSNALKGMGLEASEAGRVADVLALASVRTNSSIGSLGESISNVASTAKQLGVPFEDAVAAVALLQDVGLDASVAGSALNVMLTKMAKPPKEVARQMRKFGVTFKDAKGNMLPFQTVIKNVSIAADKAGGSFDRVAFLADLVGMRGQKAAANLADLFKTGQLEKLTDELKNAEGSAKKMADLRMDTVLGSFEQLSSAVDAVKLRIFGMNEGPLKNLIDRMTAWVTANEALIATKIGDFLGDVIENIDEIVSAVKNVAIAIGVFIAFSAVLNTLIGVLTLVNLLMAANPVGLMVIGILAAIAAVTTLVFWFDEIVAALDDMPLALKIAFYPVYAVLKAISLIKAGIKSITGGNGVDLDSFGVLAPSALSDDELGSFSSTLLGPEGQSAASEIVTPQERIARSIEEKRQTSTAEVTLKTEPGTSAAVTKGTLGGGLTLQPSGAF